MLYFCPFSDQPQQ